MRVLFRTDASLQIGTGHVMRCLALANTLRNRGATCRFVCREHPGNLLELIRKQGFETIALPFEVDDGYFPSAVDTQSPVHAAWLGTDWATDVNQTKVGVGEIGADWLIVDHYALDARWESAMRVICSKIFVVDDIADRNHDCDLLLDQNLFSAMNERYSDKVPKHCRQMLGPRYALLQPLYEEMNPRIPPREGAICRILIYFGGADVKNVTGMAVASYLALGRADIALDVVINDSNPHIESIQRQIEGNKNIKLHVGLPSLALLMAQADLAIGAGGATSWERCCMGLPSIVITLAANQTPIASELVRLGLIRWLGDAEVIGEAEIVTALRDIVATGLASEWSSRCRQIVDGQGAQRVASILMLNSQTNFRARLARVDDEAQLLHWANDRLVQHESGVPAEVVCSSYRISFHKYLRDLGNCQLYVVETESGLPIGLVRFECIDKSWQIDYELNPVVCNLGIDERLLQTAMLSFRARLCGTLSFRSYTECSQVLRAPSERQSEKSLAIAVCADSHSWIKFSIPELLLGWLAEGHTVQWANSAEELFGGDICFYLSYGKIVDGSIRKLYRNNLVVHASDLPKGRGWSPATWQILEGADRIPVTLLEADDAVDSGVIYLQECIELDGTELIDDWHRLLSISTVKLVRSFIAEYPSVLNLAREQSGVITTYPRRRGADSAIDPAQSVNEIFNHLRTVDNVNYPAFFGYKGKEFILRISAR